MVKSTKKIGKYKQTSIKCIWVPYYMKFWRHFKLANLAIFLKIAKLKMHQN